MTDQLVGDEGLLNVLFELSIVQRQENIENELSDNIASVDIPVRADVSYDVGVSVNCHYEYCFCLCTTAFLLLLNIGTFALQC